MRRGYTLLELLIAVSMLITISACLVFNFSSTQDKMLLDEGVINIQTLVRFSKAHSMNTGKTVKIVFPETELGDDGEAFRQQYPNNTVVVLSDGEPLETTRYYVDIINKSVHIESSSNSQIVFYPDGSNEDVVVTVSSVSDEDRRKFEISIKEFSVKVREPSTTDNSDPNF